MDSNTLHEFDGFEISDDLNVLGIVDPNKINDQTDQPDDAEKWLEAFSKDNDNDIDPFELLDRKPLIIPVIDPNPIIDIDTPNIDIDDDILIDKQNSENEQYLIYHNDGQDVDLETLGKSKLIYTISGSNAEGFLECLYQKGVRITIALMKACYESETNPTIESESGLTYGDEIFEWNGYYLTRNEIHGYITLEK